MSGTQPSDPKPEIRLPMSELPVRNKNLRANTAAVDRIALLQGGVQAVRLLKALARAA